MDDGEDVLELGGRRRPVLTGALVALVRAAAIGGYLALHDRGGSSHRVAARTAAPPSHPETLPAPSLSPSTPTLPPWPQVATACDGTTFVPIVHAEPLQARTDLHLLVGPRLSRADVDSGRITPVPGMPANRFAHSVVTTGSGTYAILDSCYVDGASNPATVIRVSGGARPQVVARGAYADLLGGGDHLWGVIWPADTNGSRLDPLDGGRPLRLPDYFQPLAGSGSLVVGQQFRAGGSDAPGVLEVIDPVSRAVRVRLGPASSVTVGSGLVVWSEAGCVHCAVHTYDYDPATGARTTLPRTLSADVGLWAGVISPDRRWIAFVRQSARPGPYAPDHPGNPNEVAVLDLRTGARRTVGGVLVWAKGLPGSPSPRTAAG